MNRRDVLAATLAVAMIGAGTSAFAQSTMDKVRESGVLRVGVTQAPP